MGMSNLKLLSAPVLALVLAGTACHTDQRQGKLPAAQANAPALAAGRGAVPQADPAPIPTEQAQIAPRPNPDPVADLIVNAEKEYQAGEEKFKAGDLEAAKRSFDRAVDMLSQSPAEIRSDDRIEHELDRVLDSVNRPELAALQSDIPDPKQKAEPAPIDEVNDEVNDEPPG